MTHEELLSTLNSKQFMDSRTPETPYFALRAVVELHKPITTYDDIISCYCISNEDDSHWDRPYPCPTIQAIERELR